MSKLLRTPQSKQDLLDIGDYIAQFNPKAAFDLLDELESKFQILADSPLIGQLCADLAPGLPSDLRQFPVGSYVVFYRPTEDGIVVYRVLHGRRVPQVFRDEQLNEDESLDDST